MENTFDYVNDNYRTMMRVDELKEKYLCKLIATKCTVGIYPTGSTGIVRYITADEHNVIWLIVELADGERIHVRVDYDTFDYATPAQLFLYFKEMVLLNYQKYEVVFAYEADTKLKKQKRELLLNRYQMLVFRNYENMKKVVSNHTLTNVEENFGFPKEVLELATSDKQNNSKFRCASAQEFM